MDRVDFLVIGAGIAGLCAAIRLADVGTVLVVTKEELAESNTAYAQGGIAVIEKRNIEKAKLLYDCIDGSGFYTSPVRKEDRSRMNVPFRLRDESQDDAFLKGAKERGMVQLKGHRSVGGMRASIYNAMPIEGVRALVDYMKEFEKRHG